MGPYTFVASRHSFVLSVVASHGIMHAYLVVLPALLPLVKADLGDIQTIGFLASLVFIFYGWGSLPAGFLADRYSKKILIVASMGLCGVASILVGLSQSLPSAALSFTLLGVGASLYHPPGYASVSLLSLEMRGRYMGVQGLGGEIGMALAYITSPVLGVFLGWRITFILWGMIGLAMAATNFFAIAESKSQSTRSEMIQDKDAGTQVTSGKTFSAENLWHLLVVLIIVICSGALWNGVSSFILAYINEVKGLQLFISGGLTTISYTIGAFAQVVGGELCDRYGRRIILELGFSSFAVFLILLTLTPSSILLMMLIVSMLGFTFYLTQSPLNALLGDFSTRKTVGSAYGVNFAVKYGIGGISPAVAGFLAVNYSMDYVFYFFSVIATTAFLLSLIAKDSHRRK